uniref:Uncharacterized protein n=1 Tax=Romanomermis culicivorax TaxID=13658 RepID=A0A915HYG9_ROMCU
MEDLKFVLGLSIINVTTSDLNWAQPIPMIFNGLLMLNFCWQPCSLMVRHCSSCSKFVHQEIITSLFNHWFVHWVSMTARIRSEMTHQH